MYLMMVFSSVSAGLPGTFHLYFQCWNFKYGPQATCTWSGATPARHFQFLCSSGHGPKKSVLQDRAACIILPKIKYNPLHGD